MILKIPATSANLGPGFDCIGMALDLYNFVEFHELNEGMLEIIVEKEGSTELPTDHNNLLFKAYKSVFEYLNKPVMGIHLKLINNIPLSRGLGSSAAAVVGGVLVANKILGEPLTKEELLKLAVKIEGHPDNVAPALFGGIVLSGSNGDQVFYRKISPGVMLKCSVLIPDFHLSTKKARSVLPKMISLQDAIFNVGRMGLLVDALHSENYEMLNIAIEDKLHQPYRSKLIPGLDDIFKLAKELNLLGVSISGAGPTVIVFHKDGDQDKVKKLQEVFKNYNIDSNLVHLNPIEQGVVE
ncbi:homoserine kinase [Desulfonispora thiosulfatigenes DSM 11270]|uniref:Homoserine kinase n=1 Tax=Desulfonispora thiosulfatigenes DSM 11270 TaxID=656914 RepID=A0A1W1VMD4_DESTI|nr:homoserine kinase [Desulfonispora thiosulfatigenes]SMB94488.1 homoserine kinase [Desulfonispora thiosulfatigenes DSM 11270]